ncbi:MAG: 30S ribosomal protein S25e [Candidatus Bathyarchaeia archaeon]
MGGKKKPTLSQAEKAQMREATREEGKKEAKTKTPAKVEKKLPSVIIPNPRDEKIIKEIQKMKVLTPYTIASRFNLRLSVAKDFLEELCRQGVITLVSAGRHLKIYKPAATAA